MQEVVFTKEQRYDGRTYKPGERGVVNPAMFKALSLLKRVEPVGEVVKAAPKPKRKYTRRDMRAK